MSAFRFLVREVHVVRSISQKAVFSHSIVKSNCFKNVNLRKLHMSNNRKAYEASGKTTGFIVNKNMSEACCISSITVEGFELANGFELVGPIIVFPHLVFSWNIESVNDINEESMTLFKVMEPRLDLLILGYGNKEVYTPQAHKNFAKICKDLGIRFESLPTEQACGLFNFLSVEHRYLAAALIPPTKVDVLKLDTTKKLSIEDMEEEEDTKLLPDVEEKKLLK